MYRDKHQRNFARSLHNESTDAEKRLWQLLRAEQLRGHKFRRQAAIGPYIVDFVCFSPKLIFELDGPQHFDPDAIEHDVRRSTWLSSGGFQVIRVRNQQLDENIHTVVEMIERALEALSAQKNPPPQPSPPRGGSRMSYNGCTAKRAVRGPSRPDACGRVSPRRE
jgi:very-short-patch-repair endonuclease